MTTEATPPINRRLSVLMPVYNESRTLRSIVKQVLAAPVDLEIELVAVDDASGDDSWVILEELSAADPRIKVFRHPVNRGKGAAIRTAIANMTGDIAIVQDSDLEYDPKDFPKRPQADPRRQGGCGLRFSFRSQRGAAGPLLLAFAGATRC
jgi:glycosyltransferase involved in cell wall biosynthesis